MPVPRWIREIGRGLLDVVYPPRCLGCGGRPESVRLPICPRCLQSLERAPVMGVAARLDRLSYGRGALDGAAALWVFDKGGTLQAVQHALKYGERPRYGVALGELIGRAYAETFAPPFALPSRKHAGSDVETGDASPPAPFPGVNGVVPIPLHRMRELERGYNQSATLAQGVATALGLPVRPDVLTRPNPTRSQTHLSRRERWQNVCAAFAASPDSEGGSWLLIDDVLTTGSTATAAAQALKDAGADRVTLAVLAIART